MFNSKVIEIPAEYQPRAEDLPGDLARIAAAIEEHRPGQGVELTLFLAQVFRGQNLYVRNVDEIIRRIRDDAIRREYDAGVTVRELASKCRLSQRSVEKIISRPDSDRCGRQLELFNKA